MLQIKCYQLNNIVIILSEGYGLLLSYFYLRLGLLNELVKDLP